MATATLLSSEPITHMGAAASIFMTIPDLSRPKFIVYITGLARGATQDIADVSVRSYGVR